LIIHYEIDDDRLLLVRIADKKRRTKRRFTACGSVDFDPQGPLFAVCADKPLGHSVDPWTTTACSSRTRRTPTRNAVSRLCSTGSGSRSETLSGRRGLTPPPVAPTPNTGDPI